MSCAEDDDDDGACAVCGRGRGRAEVCDSCRALALCGQCAATHSPAECARLRSWMEAGPPSPPSPTSCAILAAVGVHGVGVWARACARPGEVGGAAWGALAPPLPSSTAAAAAAAGPARLPDLAGFLGLPRPDAPDLGVVATPADAARAAAGPAGLVLHRAATAALAVARAREARAAAAPAAPPGATFTLALLGVRAEVDAWPALLYIACLAPSSLPTPEYSELHVACVGPDVPAALDGAAAVFAGPARGAGATTRLSFARGRWHEARGRLPRPDAVAALDAGLGASPGDWLPTLASLVAEDAPPPILVTDLHGEAAAAATAVARAGLGGSGRVRVSDPVPNPRRRAVPSRRPAGGLRLPTHECGWAFWIEAVGGNSR